MSKKSKKAKKKKEKKQQRGTLHLAADPAPSDDPGTEEAVSKVLDLRADAPEFSNGSYPYKKKIKLRDYEEQKHLLQIELLKMQSWVKETGQRVAVLFEGTRCRRQGWRHQALHGASQSTWRTRMGPREAERAGERGSGSSSGTSPASRPPERLRLFDRSWYNRAGVDRVMGFCNSAQYLEFMRQAPQLERMLVNDGIHLFKYWFSVSREEQLRRFRSRKGDLAQAMEAQPDRSPIARQVG